MPITDIPAVCLAKIFGSAAYATIVTLVARQPGTEQKVDAKTGSCTANYIMLYLPQQPTATPENDLHMLCKVILHAQSKKEAPMIARGTDLSDLKGP
eukprot:4942794-Pleurochrysis_carterae.AAC.3